MDPLSISASIAGLVSLADLVFRQTKKYVKSARGSYKEVNDLYREVQGLSNVLHKLSLVAFDLELEATEGATIPFETAIDPSCIRECDLLLGRLRKGLSDTKSDLGSSSAFNRLQALLKWPFSSTETRELLDDVRRQKQVIDTAIAADSLGKMRSILSNQEKISAEMSDIQTAAQQILDNQAQVFADKQKKAVFDFFSKIDHRAEFEKNKRLRHSQTSLWLTQGQDFDEWYSTPGGRMWCSGIPGAGKSVIAVSVIEECLRRREVYKDTAVAYVFCTYRDASTYELSAILSSLCAQLALHNEQALEVLSNYHEELKKGSCSASQPSTDGLVRVVHEMSSFFSSVYLVIDGLDECGDHLATNVRSLTGISLSQREKLINLAILSRDELIIRQSLEPMFHHIEIAAQPEDIQLYVASQLEERIKTMNLKFRNLELKDQIMTELVDGAQGMFRWVACQLDHICNLPSDRARRYALGKLPPTLPATYERILTELDKLNDEAKQLVQRTLLLISLPPLRQLTFDELCEAISVDLDSDTLVDDDLVEKEEVLRWCGSLVRQSVESRTVEFSHFTVQKYLEEDCPKHPTIHQYGVSKDKAYALLGSLCLRYLTLKAPNYQLLPESAKAAVDCVIDRRKSHPFYEYASISWPFLTNNEGTCGESYSQALHELFAVAKTPSFRSWAVEVICHCLLREDEFGFSRCTNLSDNAHEVVTAVSRPDFTSLHMSAALGMPDLCQQLLQKGADPCVRSRFGTPFHCAIGSFIVFADKIVQEHPSIMDNLRPSFISPSARHRAAQILVRAGAKHDLQLETPFVRTVPFYLAISSLVSDQDLENVIDLIQLGLPVNTGAVELFQDRCHHMQAHHVQNGQTFFKLINVLRNISAPSEAQGNLCNAAWNFCNGLGLQALRQPSKSSLKLDAEVNEESFLLCFLNAIETNDTPSLRRQIDGYGQVLLESKPIDRHAPDWSPVHHAVESNSLDALKLLLERGFSGKKVSEEGGTPVHFCSTGDKADLLSVLLRNGESVLSLDDDGETVWHWSAYENSTSVLRVLLDAEELEKGLQMISNTQQTPICVALSAGHHEAVQLLLPYCGHEKFWKSNASIYRDAARLGSADVIRALLDTGVERDGIDDETGNPLHFLSPESSLECVKLFAEHFVLDQLRTSDNRLPLETILERAVEDGMIIGKQIIQSLVPMTSLSSAENGSRLWKYACVKWGASSKIPIFNDLFTVVFTTFQDMGIAKLFESRNGVSALVPFLGHYTTTVPNMHAQLLTEPDVLEYRPNWEAFSKIFFSLTKTTQWPDRASDRVLERLLSLAILHDDHAMVRLLTQKGVDIFSRKDVLSPFDVACFPGARVCDHCFESLLATLPSAEIASRIASGIREDGRGPFHFFAGSNSVALASESRLKLLIQTGADYNLPVSEKFGSPLVYHIGQNATATAELLIACGANPWVATSGGFDAALTAIDHSHCFLLEIIWNKHADRADAHPWNRRFIYENGNGILYPSCNALHVAAKRDCANCLNFYLDKQLLPDLEEKDSLGQTAFIYCSGARSIEILHAAGADIDTVDNRGRTRLHRAAFFGDTKAVEMLLKLGAKFQACHSGCTPLDMAWQNKHHEIIDILQKAADPEIHPAPCATNSRAQNSLALRLKIAIERNDAQACKGILARGCPVDIALNDPAHSTPLALAVQEGAGIEVVRRLLAKGASVSAFCRKILAGATPNRSSILQCAAACSDLNPLLKEMVKRYWAEVGSFTHPSLLMHAAVDSDNLEGLRVVLDTVKGIYDETGCVHTLAAFVNQKLPSRRGTSALHLAAGWGNIQAVKLLIAHGADVSQRDDFDATPLHWAARSSNGAASNCGPVIAYLLELGAHAEALDSAGCMPLVVACTAPNLVAIDALEKCSDLVNLSDIWGRSLLHCLSRWEGLGAVEHLPLFQRCLAEGGNLGQPSIDGVSAMQMLFLVHPSTFLWHLANKDIGMLKFQSSLTLPSIILTRDKVNSVAKNRSILSRILRQEQILDLFDIRTIGRHGLFCEATCSGAVEAIPNLLRYQHVALLKHTCYHHGEPLAAALLYERLETVKCLVRHGARLPPDFLRGKAVNVLGTKGRYSEILRWLFIGQHFERKLVTLNVSPSESEVKPLGTWSGPRKGRMKMELHWRQWRDESMLEYAERLHAVLRSLRGEVQKVTLV